MAAHGVPHPVQRSTLGLIDKPQHILLLLALLATAGGSQSEADSRTHVEMVFSYRKNPSSVLPDIVHYNLPVEGQVMTLKLQKNDLMKAASVFTTGSSGRLEILDFADDIFENTEFYQDVHGLAAVSLKKTNENGSLYNMEGIIFRRGSSFHIRPSGESLKTGAKERKSLHVLRKMTMTSGVLDYWLPRPEGASLKKRLDKRQTANGYNKQRDSRYRRGIPQYEIDMLYVTDYSTLQSTLQEMRLANTYATSSMALQEMRYYFAHVSNAVDMRYRNINSALWTVRTKLVAFYMSTTAADSAWTESLKASDGLTSQLTVNASAALGKFQKWVTGNTFPSAMPSFDHAVLFTGYNIFRDTQNVEKNYDVIGLAYLGALCTTYSVSIVELTGAMTEAGTVAHELGHSLGATHDGEGNVCQAKSQYIMSSISRTALPETELNYYRFSECSISLFTSYIGNLTSNLGNCMTDTGSYYNITEWETNMQLPPGQVYSLNDMCRQSFGPTYEVCGGVGYGSTICRKLYCHNTSEALNTSTLCHSSAGGRGLDGTTCGNHKWCQGGVCIANNSAPSGSDLCPIGDFTRTAQVYSDTPYVCSNMPSYYCYDQRVYNDCCPTCAQREDVSRPGCKFGDRADCSAVRLYECQLNLENCCKSCQERKLPIPGCEWGDYYTDCDKFYPQCCTSYPKECCATCYYGSSTTSVSPLTTRLALTSTAAAVPATTRSTATPAPVVMTTMPLTASATPAMVTNMLPTAASSTAGAVATTRLPAKPSPTESITTANTAASGRTTTVLVETSSNTKIMTSSAVPAPNLSVYITLLNWSLPGYSIWMLLLTWRFFCTGLF